jgi:uncharacterized membrane protein
LLLNIGAAVALARLLRPLLGRHARHTEGGGSVPVAPFDATAERERGQEKRASGRSGVAWWIWLGGLALLIAGVAIYPLRMTPERLNERATAWPELASAHIAPTLDGMAFLKVVYPNDYAAIQWINDTIPGSPVLLQSRYGSYTNMSTRLSMYTGLPTVFGWDNVEGEQRYNGQDAGKGRVYPDQISTREADVDLIYSTTNIPLALRLLHRYGVSYICVGTEERGDPHLANDQNAFHGYPAAGLAKFPLMARQHTLAPAFSQGAVQIYKVL